MQVDKSQDSHIHIPIVSFLNKIVTRIAEATAWLNVALIFIILTQVTLRYGFNSGMATLEELIWHLYAIAFMFGVAYAITTDSHIRVDIIHSFLSKKSQRIIEILGILFLLMPFIIIVLDHSLAWVAESYRVLESSSSPTGLPYRWIIKSVIPITLVLMFIAALARLIKEVVLLIKHDNHSTEASGRVLMIKKLFSPQFQDTNQEKK